MFSPYMKLFIYKNEFYNEKYNTFSKQSGPNSSAFSSAFLKDATLGILPFSTILVWYYLAKSAREISSSPDFAFGGIV